MEQRKSILAAAIIGVLVDDRKLSVRKAEGVTGINASAFSRIRTARLSRFTVDRLMTILNRLNRHVDVQVTTRPFARPVGPRLPLARSDGHAFHHGVITVTADAG